MAINLTAVFKVKDEGSSKLRKLTQSMEQMNKASSKVSSSVNSSQQSIKKLGSSSSSASGGVSRMSKSLAGLATAAIGVASAYISAQGAAKLFNSTIGEAARYEQSEVAVQAIFNDKEASDAYLKMVDKMAIDSPLLNSGDMLASSKSLVAMTKNVDELGDAWSIIERLMVLDPTQGIDGAAFALKEMWQGDALSMVERFGLDKKALNDIKKMSIPQQISEINKLLEGMGITQETVEAMGKTTLGYWAQIQERVGKFKRMIGDDGNSKLGKALGEIVDSIDGMDLDSMARKIGDVLGTAVEKAIAFGKLLWEWREPIIAVAKAVGTVALIIGSVLAVAGVVAAIGALTTPIGYIVIGITAAVAGFKMLYKNSETFRNSINGIMEKVKGLYNAFQSGGVGGLLDAMFGEGTTGKVSGIIATIVEKFNQLKSGFEIVKGALVVGWQTVSDIFMSAWGIVSPILSGLWSLLQIVGDIAVIVFNNVIAPAIAFLMQLFSTLWTIAQPILQQIADKFEILAAVIKWLWDVILKPLVEFLLGNFKKGFENATKVLEGISAAFETVTGWVQKAKDLISDFASAIKKVKVPDWVSKLGGGAVSFVQKVTGGGKTDGSHYHGLDYVPRDNYVSALHRGEMVLNARDAKAYREGKGGGGITIAKLADQIIVREEADIDKFAYKLAKLIEKEALQIG